VLLGDVQDEGIDWQRVAHTYLGRAQIDDFLVSGDIIIRSRGSHYGVVLAKDPPPRTVVAAPLFLLSVKQAGIRADYIAWYLNRAPIRSLLATMARGTSLPTISIRDLAELEIPVPSPEIQAEIAEIVALLNRERDLSNRLIDLRAHLGDAILAAMIEGKVRKKEPIRTFIKPFEEDRITRHFERDEDEE
jgi:hypothetical protein